MNRLTMQKRMERDSELNAARQTNAISKPHKKIYLIMHKNGYVVKAISNPMQAKRFLHLTKRVFRKDARNHYIQEHPLFHNWIRGWL